MQDDGSHGCSFRPEDFFDVKRNRQHVVDEIIKGAVRRRGLPPGRTWEDVRQDVLIKFWLWLKTGREVDNPVAVLTTFAENHLIDLHRQQTAERRDTRKEVHLDAPEHGERAQRLAGFEKDIRGRVLIDELRESLSGDDREIFEQHVYEGRRLIEIARERGVSKQAVAARWARILKKLKKKLRPLV